MGVKGVGEAGTIASTPAVINAVVDALRPWGVDDIEMPASPQRVWRALRDGSSAESSQDLPMGTHEIDLEPGGRVGEGEIGPENADPGLAAGLPSTTSATTRTEVRGDPRGVRLRGTGHRRGGPRPARVGR